MLCLRATSSMSTRPAGICISQALHCCGSVAETLSDATGSGLFFAGYLAAMFSVPVPAGQPDTQDDAAAVGLIFLAVPTAIAVGFVVSLGT